MEIYTEKNQTLEQRPSFRQHMTKTFGWMFIGLVVTFAIAYAMGLNEEFTLSLFANMPFLPIVIIVAELAVVIALSSRVGKMAPTTAKILYLAYAALTGITFSILVVVYSAGTVAQAFLTSAVYFGCLAVIGLTTRRDLTSIGTICFGALLAFIIYQVLALIFGWGMNTMLYSMIGLLIFAGITAWDAQKIKKNYIQFENEPQKLESLSIYSALSLYLDFINIFLYILRIFGSGKD